jgi:hypothetical protein
MADKKHEDVFDEAQKRITLAWDADRDNRVEGIKDLRFLAGDQWDEAARNSRINSSRPCLTINRLPQFVNRVANEVRKQPPEVKIIPADGAAGKDTAEIYEGLIRQIQYRSAATSVYAGTERSAVSCGIGHFRLNVDYEDGLSFNQEILLKPIRQPMAVLWDPDAAELSRKDAEYCFVLEPYTRDAFAKRFGEDAPQNSFTSPSDDTESPSFTWMVGDKVIVAEYWRKVPVKKTIALLETGETIDITDMDEIELSQLQVIRTREMMGKKIEQYILGGDGVLEGPNDWAGSYIPIFPVIGMEIPTGETIVRCGLIRFARDPQVLYNFARSNAAEVMGQAPRSPFLVTHTMIAKAKSQWDTANTIPRPYLLFEPDPDVAGGRPIRENPPPVPTAFIDEAQIADDEMKATTGIYDSSLGARSNEISGVAIKTREMQGESGTLHFLDNLLATLHHLGAVLIDLIPKIYDAERAIRVVKEDDTQEHVTINQTILGDDGQPRLINDLSVGAYDVRVKIGPTFATKRAESAESMLEFIRNVPGAAGITGDLIARSMDWPGAEQIAKRLERMLPPQLQPEPENEDEKAKQAQEQQIQQQKQSEQEQLTQLHARGELENLLADAQLKQAKTQEIASKTAISTQGQQVDPVLANAEREQALLKIETAYQNMRKTKANADHSELLVIARMLDNLGKSAENGSITNAFPQALL